ncbi:1,5-anhydro-D-fructose reductase-like [Oppia nitens]|uniref:1,5-anhydro-D-fructose reductase-like n=1 Tax=Oppia nitens TaxID=1686743 RepID=UPI0023DBA745|nr:1,5-anhydro-D-fructose reductase-like [Oppia nitens]
MLSTTVRIVIIIAMLAIVSVVLIVWLVNTSSGLQIPNIELVNGVIIPQIGLGTYQIQDEATAKRIIGEAIDVGYRHIDTAYHYQNEKFIGDKLKDLFDRNVINRDDVFVTTKVWNTFHRKDSVIRGLNESLQALGLKQVDLALIHFPMAFKEDTGEYIPVDSNGLTLDLNVDIYETWQGMEQAYHRGMARSIGVSNFNISQLQHIIKNGFVKPLVNQVEIHPYLTQEPLVDFCHQHNIVVVAYSPIAKANQTLFNEPVLKEIAAKHEKTVAQVIMKWLVQRNIVVIPKTTKKERLIENFNIFDFQLTDTEMRQISGLNKDYRITRFTNARNNPNYPYEWPLASK